MQEKDLILLKKLIGEDAKIISSLSGGMMNEAFVVESKKGKFVFYLPTKQANEMVNRKLEKATQAIAESLLITRSTFYFDEKTGIKLLKFIEGESLNHLLNFDPKKIALLFLKLHQVHNKINVDYNPFTKIENYKKEASIFVKNFDSNFNKFYKELLLNKNFLEKQEKSLCHNDSQRSNIIKDNDDNYFLIDYEFSMDNDPVYDIAAFGNDDVNDGLKVLDEYKKLIQVNDAEKRFYLWRIFISLQWYLVALIKHYRGEGKTHNIDFLKVAEHFLDNAFNAYKGYVFIQGK